MKSNREIKLAEIKNHSPSLYQKVVDGDVQLQQAYNYVMGDINSITEYKDRGTKGQNKIGLPKEVDRLEKMYKGMYPGEPVNLGFGTWKPYNKK